MSNSEKHTIVNPKTGSHYDTNDERFYDQSWDRTLDSKPYLERLITNNPEKFEDCVIEEAYD